MYVRTHPHQFGTLLQKGLAPEKRVHVCIYRNATLKIALHQKLNVLLLFLYLVDNVTKRWAFLSELPTSSNLYGVYVLLRHLIVTQPFGMKFNICEL